MMMPYHDEQLQFIIDLAVYRTSFLDPIFRFLNYVDSLYFVFLLLPIVWVGFSYRWGIRLFYLLVVNEMMNSFFKNLVGWARPCMDFSEVGMYHPISHGFPSGGAQAAMVLGGLVIYYWKNKYAWPIGVFYILLLSFTRLYLGVHYPIDILGGWVLGLLLLYVFIQTIHPFEKFLATKGLLYSFILSEAIPLLLFLLTAKRTFHRLDAIVIGLGIFLSLKYGLYLPYPKKIPVAFLRGAIAAVGVFALFILLENFPFFVSIGIVSLWLSLGASPFCKWALKRHV